MSIYVYYDFRIKSENPKLLLKSLLNKNTGIINLDYLVKMPSNLQDVMTYDTWAEKTFGYSYNWPIDSYEIKDNVVRLYIHKNKTYYNLQPWFNKFKNNLDVYEADEYDNGDYHHAFYKNKNIVWLNHWDELGIELKRILNNNNKKEILEYLQNNYYLPEGLNEKELTEIISTLIEKYPKLYKYIPNKYKSDLNFVKKVLNKNNNIYDLLDIDIQKNREVIITLLNSENNNLNEDEVYGIYEIINEYYKDDIQVLKLLVKYNSKEFLKYQYLLNDDKEVALSILGKNSFSGKIFDLLSDRLKNDIDIAMKTVEYEPYNNYSSIFNELYKDNKEVALHAIEYESLSRYHQYVLSHLSDRLRNDDDIVNKSISHNPLSFEYAGDKFKNDINLCIKVLKIAPSLINSMNESFLEDYDFCENFIKTLKSYTKSKKCPDFCSDAWRYILEKIKNEQILNDKEFVIDTIKNGAYLWNVNNRYINDKEIMIPALVKDKFLYEHIPDEYHDNKEYAIAALSNKLSLPKIKGNQKFLDRIDRMVYSTLINFLGRGWFNSLFYESSGDCLQYASDKLKDNKEIVEYAISSTPHSFIYASDRLKDDKEIFMYFINKMGLKVKLEANDDFDEIVTNVINNVGNLYNFLSLNYRSRMDIIEIAIDKYVNTSSSFEMNIPFDKLTETNRIDIMAKLMTKWPDEFKGLDYKYRNNNKIVINEIKANGNNLKYAGNLFQKSKKYIDLAKKNLEITSNEKFYQDINMENGYDDIIKENDIGTQIDIDDFPF